MHDQTLLGIVYHLYTGDDIVATPEIRDKIPTTMPALVDEVIEIDLAYAYIVS